MIQSSIENFQTEPKPNSEQKPITSTSAQVSANAMLVAGLLSKGDVIVSSRTGKELLCYTEPHNIYIGNGNTIVNIDYYLWDAVKKKSKCYKGREIKAMLEGVWSVKPCH